MNLQRQKFVHQGKTVYEWEQTLEDVIIYVTPPEGVKAKMIDCQITNNHFTLGFFIKHFKQKKVKQ